MPLSADHVARRMLTELLENQKYGTYNVNSGGTITAAAGTAAAPSIRLTGSLDSGLAAPVADELMLVANGAEVISLNSSTDTADGMNQDPETAQEDGFITGQVGAQAVEIPYYDAA